MFTSYVSKSLEFKFRGQQ